MTKSISELIDAFVNAIEAETAAYRAIAADDPERTEQTPNSKALNSQADESTFRVINAEQELLSLPTDQVFAETDRTGDMDYIQALALAHRRWLVMDGRYADQANRTECRLIDMILDSSRYDEVPLLWHIKGVSFRGRPSDEVLQAGWKSADGNPAASHAHAREGRS